MIIMMEAFTKKGILESVTDFFQIVVAIAIALIMVLLAYHFFASQTKGNGIQIIGNVDQASSTIAQYMVSCWENHREGLDPQSAVCTDAKITTNMLVTEKNVTKYLDCETIPDNGCPPDDCSKCTSSRYPNDSQDKVIWEFDNSTQYIEISYVGAERSLKISNALSVQ